MPLLRTHSPRRSSLEFREVSHFVRRQLSRFRAFLHSKDALVYLSFVLLATVIWFANAFNTRRVVTLMIPVSYTHIPDDYIFVGSPTGHVQVSLEDEGIDLFANRKRLYELTFDLSEHIRGEEGTFIITMDELRQGIIQQLVGDAALVAFEPEVLAGAYTRQHEKVVPVVYTGQIKPAAQHQLNGKPLLIPGEVHIYGTTEDIAAIDHVETVLTDYEGVQDTFLTRIPLIVPPGLRALPDTVGLQVIAERFTEKLMQLPIRTPDLSSNGEILHLFPAQVNVTFHIGTNWFADVREDDIKVYVDLPQDGSDRLHVKVECNNPHITHLRIKPEEVEYLIEKYETYSDGRSSAPVPED